MIDIDAKQALELPVDELALLVLADLIRENEWNEYNYGLKYRQDSRTIAYAALADTSNGFGSNPHAQNAIAEAMGWLRAQGMIARPPGNSSDASIFVTRWGHEALKKDVAQIRAISRLQQNLHPTLERRVRRQFLLGEYENAIFVALKAVEVRVRTLGGFGDDVIGVDLMTRAFKAGGRSLTLMPHRAR